MPDSPDIPSTSYRDAGVDIEAGAEAVERIREAVRSTYRPEVIGDIGGFGGLFSAAAFKDMDDPVLVSGTDGVGTKLKIAFMMDRHDTVGIDLVAMCVNDILTLGAEPLFFLDYFATGRLRSEKAKDIVKGIAEGCQEAGCALIGGETAEMPGFYQENEYDLAGFSVGVVERREIIDGSAIQEGDAIIGLASNGLHSNGYSLVRKVFLEAHGFTLDRYVPELGTSLGEELLRPTRIYVKAHNALKGRVSIRGMAHITGGGIPGNLPRVLRDGLVATVKADSWTVPPVFVLTQKLGNVPEEDMRRTFNMGIGYVIVVGRGDEQATLSILKERSLEAQTIGHMERAAGQKVRYV
jgi:phosphoribosylformylglycinamidine cyclo-ligase